MTTHSSSNTTTSNSNDETDDLFSSSLVIVTSILGHCHFTDLFNAQLVNRSWCRYANSRGVWEVMIIKKLNNIDFNQYTPLYSTIIINGRYQLQPIQETQYRYDLFNATPKQFDMIKYESSQYSKLDALSYYNKNLTNQTYLKSLFQYLFPHDYSLHHSLQFVQSLTPIMLNSNNNNSNVGNNNSNDQNEAYYFVKNYNHKNIDSSYLDSKFGYISRKVTCPLGVIENDILGHIKKSIRYGECKLIDGENTDRYNTPPPNINGYIFIPQEQQSISTGSWDGSICGNFSGTFRIEKQTILVPSPSSSTLNNNQSIDNGNIQYYKTIQITEIITNYSYPALGYPSAEYYGDTNTFVHIQLIDHSKEGKEIHLRKTKSFKLVDHTKGSSDGGSDSDDSYEEEEESIYQNSLEVNLPLKNIKKIMEFINLPQSTSRDDIESMVKFLLPSGVRKRNIVVDSISRYDFNPIMISNAKQLKYKIKLLEEINTRNEFKNDIGTKNKLINFVQQMYDIKKWKNGYSQHQYQQTLNWDFQVTFTVPYNGDGKLEISILISLCDPDPAIDDDHGEVFNYYTINIKSIYNGTELVIYNEEMSESRHKGRTGTNLQDNLNQSLHEKYPHFPIDMVTLLKLFKVDNHIKLEYGEGNNLIYLVENNFNGHKLEQHLQYVMNDQFNLPNAFYKLAGEAEDDNYDLSKYTPLFTSFDDISWWEDINVDEEEESEDDDGDQEDDDSDNTDVNEELGNEEESNQETDTIKKGKSDLKRSHEDQGEENINTKYQKHDNQ